jgi:hypothetical protein
MGGSHSADGQGFEPWVPVRAHTLSKRAQSTALPPILRSQKSSLARVAVIGNFLSSACRGVDSINHQQSTINYELRFSEPKGLVGEVGGLDHSSLVNDHGDLDFGSGDHLDIDTSISKRLKEARRHA